MCKRESCSSGTRAIRRSRLLLALARHGYRTNGRLDLQKGSHTFKTGVLVVRNRKDQNGRPV